MHETVVKILDKEVTVLSAIKFSERASCISDAIELVFPEGNYISYMEEFAFRYEVIKYYTNALSVLFKQDDTVDSIWEVIGDNDVWDIVVEAISKDIDEVYVEFLHGVSARRDKESLASIDEVTERVSVIADTISDIGLSLNDLLNTVTKKLKKINFEKIVKENLGEDGIKELVGLAKKLSNASETDIANIVLKYQKDNPVVAKNDESVPAKSGRKGVKK